MTATRHPSAGAPSGGSRRRSLRGFLRPYRGSLSLASGLILVETLLDLARPWPLKLAVDNAIGGRPLGGPLAVLDQLGPAGLAAVAAVAGIGLVGVGALIGYLVTYLTAATAERVGADLREAVFGRMLGLALPFHDRHRSGDLVTRLTGDVARVEDSLVAWFTVLVPEVLTLAGMIVVVLAVDLTLGLAALAVAPPRWRSWSPCAGAASAAPSGCQGTPTPPWPARPARAILRDASVLLLDEPTSGLDAASEHAVLDALDRAAEGRTVLAVSHRLSLAARADRVVVLDGGRVVEQGPPGELLAAGGAYARLWALQHPQEPAVTGRSGEGVNS
jgi:ABC-type multidrug transport system fused ATPase/permease subunit